MKNNNEELLAAAKSVVRYNKVIKEKGVEGTDVEDWRMLGMALGILERAVAEEENAEQLDKIIKVA